MATRTKTVEVAICDGCGKDCDYATSCLRCGRNFCFECEKARVVEYPHAVHFSGSDDGHYCKACDAHLLNHPNQLHSAYLEITRMRPEYKRWQADFDKRAKVAEAALKGLLP